MTYREFYEKINLYARQALKDQTQVVELLEQNGVDDIVGGQRLVQLARTVTTYLGDIGDLTDILLQGGATEPELPPGEPGSIIEQMKKMKDLADETLRLHGNKSA